MPDLETLAMAAVSICIGAMFATRFKVAAVVFVSLVALLAAAASALFFQDWGTALRIVIATVLVQVSYVTVSALGQGRRD